MRHALLVRKVIVAEVSLCLVLLAAWLFCARLLHSDSSPGFGARQVLMEPEGYLLNGQRRATKGKFQRCAFIRYASYRCRFCGLGLPEASRLAAVARRVGCEAVGVASTPADVGFGPAQSSIPVLAYVSMSWVSNRLNLNVQPTTMIVARGGKLVWYHVGELRIEDAPAALRALRRAASAP